jgi:CO/xanthine dehydrogenase Mo-binding subunit
VDAEGHLLAMEIEVVMDGGAFMTLSPVVLSRGMIHAAGPYHCDNLALAGEVRLTNSPPHGAFRGFGAPQTLFAQERHMDVIASRLGLDPAELRRRNLLHVGQTTATGQTMKDPVDLITLQEKALTLADYARRAAQYIKENTQHPWRKRGIGFATFLHGAGFTGSGETMLASQAWVEAMPDGTIDVLTANTDIGQGTETVLAMVAGEALGLSLPYVRVVRPDTSRVPNSGPTVASRTTMVVGKLVENACHDLQQALSGGKGNGGGTLAGEALRKAIIAWHATHPGERLLGRAQYQAPGEVVWDDVNYRGSAYATYAYATYVADVEVDLRTYNVYVRDFVALQEIGRVVHPTLATGQIAGGVVQGIGWALMEDVIFDQGAMKNAQLTNYIIPTSGDMPPIRVYFEESPNPFGPGGAKGIGELPMDGPAPAVLNAVCHALGRQDLNTIPLTAERLMQALQG